MRIKTAILENTRYLNGRQPIPGVDETHKVFTKQSLFPQEAHHQIYNPLICTLAKTLPELRPPKTFTLLPFNAS